ncbi:hypothetical protein DFS33DRAFT_1274421 [Desarmillaria ectypa]|nr:hypothetical protein DFS33DRAFT_1274421 [Desarmillaria ectypa]
MCSSSKNLAIRPDLFVCNFEKCHSLFVHKNDLNRHLRAHYKKGVHQCPHCDRRCNQAANLKRHIDSKHLGLKPNVCPDCDYGTADKGLLVRHRKRRHGYEPQKYRKPKDVIKEVKEKRTGPLYIKRVSTLRATDHEVADIAATAPSPSPSPPPVTPPSSNVENDFWKLDWNMDMQVLPQAREVYPADRAGFPLEGLFPTSTEAPSSPLPLLDPFQPPLPTTEASGAFKEQAFGSTFANYSATADSDITNICADLFGTSVSSPSSDSFKFPSFEEVASDNFPAWMGPFDFAWA